MSRQGFRQLFKWDDSNLKELNDMLRWLYGKVTGRVEMRDLSTETKTTIDSKADGAVVGEIKDKADQAKESADAAAELVAEMSTEFEQTKEAIRLKADKTTVDELSRTVTQHSAQLEVTAEQIASKAEKIVVDELGNTVSAHSTQIVQTAEKIEQTATAVDTLEGRVEKNESAISQTPTQIQLAVERVQIGGRNLLKGTKPMDFSRFGFDSSGASAMGAYEAYEGGLHVINRQSNLRVWLNGQIPVSAGQSITVSFKYSMWSGTSPLQIQVNWYKSADDTAPGYADSQDHFPQTMQMVDGGWGWVQATFVVPDYGAYAAFAFRSGRDFELYDCEYIVREFKAESGTKATDWSPAPEDTDAAIDKLSAELVIQAGDITANATKIETVNQSAANAQNAANAAQGTANDAATRVTTAEGRISAVEGSISSMVTEEEFNELGEKVSANSSAITQTAEAIRSEVASSVSGLQTQIEQTDEQVLILAGRKTGGTNLVRFSTIGFAAVAGNTVYTDYGMWADVDETWYYRSRKMIALSPFTGDYTMVQFFGIPLKEGTQYTASFNMWHGAGGSGITLMPNIWNEGRGVDLGFAGQISVVANTPTRYELTFTCPATDTYRFRLISFGGNNAAIYLSDVKLEEGNTATAWSPNPEDPAGSVDAGGVVRVDQTGVHMSGGTIEMETSDGDEYIYIKNSGITASSLSAPNVAKRYDGPAVIWINPAATSDQIAGGSVYRSLKDLFARLNGRMLDLSELTVHMQGNDYGVMELARVVGGVIRIYGNGVTLTGGLTITDCAARVYIENMNFAASGVNQAAWAFGKGVWVQWKDCTFNGGGAGYCLFFADGANGMVWSCGLYNATNLMYVGHTCDVSALGLKGGGGTNFLASDGCTIKLTGTRPDGAWAQHNSALIAPADPSALAIDYGTAQPGTPTIQTAEFVYLHSDSYRGGWQWFSDEDIRQGYISSGTIYGVIWFDAAAIRSALNGRTINQASLRLHMHKGVGRGVAVSVQLYGSDVSYDRTAAPTLATSYGTIGTTEPDTVSEITIPTQAIQDIVSGTIQALVLKSDDAELYKDRDYSRNYAKFSGSTTATAENCPRLTVVYQ